MNQLSQGFCDTFDIWQNVEGITEPLTRTLKKHDIKVCNKPLRTLEQEFPSVKYSPPTEERNNVIYKIPCKDCAWNYVGETGRSLKTRKAEHIRNVKKHNNGSNIAKHAWDNDHVIDFDNAKIIDTGNFRSRLTLESWHTAKDRNADNNSKPLPRQYTILVKKTYYHLIIFHSALVYTSYLASFDTFAIYNHCIIIPVEGYSLVAESS